MPFSLNLLLLQIPFWSHFCNCKTDCNTGRCTCWKHNLPCTDMCGVCQGLGCRNTEPPSMTNWVFHMLLWWWQSLFILTDLDYHINFPYTNIIETWIFCELYHLACVQIIGISQKLSGLESLQFCTFSVTLDMLDILDILYINITSYLLLTLCSMNTLSQKSHTGDHKA